MEWREKDGVRLLQARLPGAIAVFTTRPGGVSQPPFDELNLGVFTDDDRDAVIENRRRLAGAIDFAPERIAFARQVHGAELVAHTAPLRSSFAAHRGAKEGWSGSAPPEADGHVVREPGIAALVFVADCVPVALHGPGGVAMLHCGWRGLAAGLIARGAEATGAIAAAIGPSIGPCCYEVGDKVMRELTPAAGEATGRMLDLPAVAGRQLREVGIERIETSGLCTACEAGLFFSHRRDAGRTGRQAGLVWLDGEGD